MLCANSTKRRIRRLCPSPERLEARSLLSRDSPTAIEELYLEELNDARFDPAAFGTSLGLDLSSVAPSQPLAMNTLLVESARLHSQDMIAQNYFSHTAPDGMGPEQRIQATGFPDTGWAESIEYNTQPAQASVGFPADYAALNTEYSLGDLIVDQGNPTLGHRVMLLDIGGGLHAMRQAGVGLASQDTPSGSYVDRQTDTTIDIASTASTHPFLTGVVFSDVANNGEYEPGGGLAGVTITVANQGSTTTLDAGGYSMQLAPGTYTVTASGGGLPAPITRTVVIGNDNARLNFDEGPNGATFSAAASKEANVTLGSFTPIQSGDTPSSYSARIDWGNGIASSATLTETASGDFTVTGGALYATDGQYAVRVLITHLSDGRSIALNSTAVVTGTSTSGGADGGGSSNPGGGPGGSSYPGPGPGKTQQPAPPGSTFFVARLNARKKPQFFDVVTLLNESGQTLKPKNVGRIIIDNKSYALHIKNWRNGAQAVVVFNTNLAGGQEFSVQFFGRRTTGLQSMQQGRQIRRFTPGLGLVFQITAGGNVEPA
jgi:serralysin